MDNKVLFGVLTILFNQIGVPCFMQGQTKAGILRIVLMIVTFGIVGLINAIKGIILGIKILQMSEEQYAEAKKEYITSGIPA